MFVKLSGLNGKYGISGGNSETPKYGIGQEKNGKYGISTFSVSPQKQGFSTFSGYGTDVPELTSGTLAGSRGGTPAQNTETAPDHFHRRWWQSSQEG